VGLPFRKRLKRDLVQFRRLRTLAVVGVSLENDSHPANSIYYKNKMNPRVKTYPVNSMGPTKSVRIYRKYPQPGSLHPGIGS
jgi:hypothetical protein